MNHRPITMDPAHAALVLVDIQPDFMPGGALPVAGGDEILPAVAALMTCGRFGFTVATQDWHPPGHVSFASSHPPHRPFDVIDLYGHEQVLWPDHCIQGTPGAALHPDLPWECAAAVIRKGMDPDCDSYSGLRNNWDRRGTRPATGLEGYLRARGAVELFVCGLARDVCVKWTALDGAAAGFRVRYIWDATRAVDPSSDEKVRAELSNSGVQLVTAAMLTGA